MADRDACAAAGSCLVSRKRYRHVCRELRARRIAEQRLTGVLEENLRIQEVERKSIARLGCDH